MERTILHIDFDSFFASVEQQLHSTFRNKPLGILASNGGTCIIAASREAKQKGIKSPTRTYEAQRICPSLLLTKADFVTYFEISKQFLSICRLYSPIIEVFSIDELFMDVTATAHLFGGVDNMIKKIKHHIAREIGEYITVSVGVSHNKLLAKLASGLNKPDGITYITRGNVLDIYAHAQLRDICGIGRRIEKRLAEIGVYTLLQLTRTPLTSLVTAFGVKEGHFLYAVGKGIDDRLVTSYTELSPIKSISRNYCFPTNEYNSRVVLQAIYELCEEVAKKLRRLQKKARTVGLSLRGTQSFHQTKTVSYHIDTARELFVLCKSFYDTWENGGMVRMISVWTHTLQDTVTIPQSLFDNERLQALQASIDALNNRFGSHTIRNGFLLYSKKLPTVPNGYLGDRLERKQLSLLQ